MEGKYLKPIMASPLWHRERCPAGGKRILANTLIRFIPFPPNPAASWAPSTSHLLLHRKASCDLIKAMRFWGFSGGCLFSVPALAWHRCLAIQSGSRNSLCSHGKKPLQNTKPFPLSLPFPWRWGAFRSFLALFGTLLPSLAFQYHGTHVATGFFLSHRWEFPLFLLQTEPVFPHHRASLSSLCPLAHTFLPCGPN